MNFQPLGSRVLIERVEDEATTSTGIIIPDNAKEKSLKGSVVAISSEVSEEGELSVGDTVMFEQYRGNEIKLDGKEYLIMETGDILGILK
jgi:chaperonin GroES